MIEFSAELIKHPTIDGAFIEMPFDPQEVFGAKRVKVKATFDGVAYRGSIVSMGGKPLIGVTKAIREEIGKQPGDTVEVTIEQDSEERTVELADDVRAAFEQAGVTEAWFKQSYSKQREHANWIEAAKKQETRQNRIAKMIEALSWPAKL